MREPVSYIVIAHHNHRTLIPCLRSVEAEAQQIDELLLILNNPDDKTSSLVAGLSRWKILYESSPGPQFARNCGAHAAQNKFLCFLDSDIVIPPGWTLKMLINFEQPWVQAGQSSIKMERQPTLGNLLKRLSYLRFNSHFYFKAGSKEKPMLACLDTAALMVRKKFFLEIGGFDVRFSRLEDSDLTLRMLYAGADIFYEVRTSALELHDDESCWAIFKKQFRSSQLMPLFWSQHALAINLGELLRSPNTKNLPLVAEFLSVMTQLMKFLGIALSPYPVYIEPIRGPRLRPNHFAQRMEGRDPFKRLIRVGSKVRVLDLPRKVMLREWPE